MDQGPPWNATNRPLLSIRNGRQQRNSSPECFDFFCYALLFFLVIFFSLFWARSRFVVVAVDVAPLREVGSWVSATQVTAGREFRSPRIVCHELHPEWPVWAFIFFPFFMGRSFIPVVFLSIKSFVAFNFNTLKTWKTWNFYDLLVKVRRWSCKEEKNFIESKRQWSIRINWMHRSGEHYSWRRRCTKRFQRFRIESDSNNEKW